MTTTTTDRAGIPPAPDWLDVDRLVLPELRDEIATLIAEETPTINRAVDALRRACTLREGLYGHAEHTTQRMSKDITDAARGLVSELAPFGELWELFVPLIDAAAMWDGSAPESWETGEVTP